MKTITKKKIFNGMVELREYERDKFVRLNTPVKVIVGDEYMVLTVSELKKGTYINTQHSIINPNQTYRMLGWRWHGTPYRDPQASLVYSTSKLRDALQRNGIEL